MAEASTASEGSGSAFGFLGHKIAGKVPVWVVAVAAVGGYYWYTHYGPGKKAASSTATSQTDPAGNVGVIDPATGFVYGSPEDLAAISAGGFGGDTGGDTGGGVTGGGTAPNPGSTAPAPTVNPAPPPPASPIARKPPILTPSRGTSTTSYTVKKGDTLASVAAKYHISVAELAHNNTYVPGEVAGNKKVGQPLGTGAGLKTGQVLKIP